MSIINIVFLIFIAYIIIGCTVTVVAVKKFGYSEYKTDLLICIFFWPIALSIMREMK